MGKPLAQPGVVLALHVGRDHGDFVVIKRVTGREYPPVDVASVIAQYRGQGSYPHVWWQPIEIPENQLGQDRTKPPVNFKTEKQATGDWAVFEGGGYRLSKLTEADAIAAAWQLYEER